MKRPALTRQQRENMSFIESYFKEHERAPSQAEIAQACNVRQGNVGKILAALEKKNYVNLKYGEARGIELVVWKDEGDK